jgi:hypothetical protein
MMYELVITRKEPNPKWSIMSNQGRYGQLCEESQYLTQEQALQVLLTEDEFNAVKKAVLEVIK